MLSGPLRGLGLGFGRVLGLGLGLGFGRGVGRGVKGRELKEATTLRERSNEETISGTRVWREAMSPS